MWYTYYIYCHHTAHPIKKEGGIAVKKRIWAILFVVVFCLATIAEPLPAAADTPCFMAVNDNLLELNDQYIPIVANGQYYVPYTVLDSSVTGLELGIFPVYNTLYNTIVVYSRDQVLSFDLSTGICTNRSGAVLSARSVTRNGRVYVPARFICEYFGLSYSNRSTTYGPLVRIRSESATLDDNAFVGLAQLMMEERLKDWNKTQTGQETPPVSTTPTPVTPAQGPSTTDKSDVRAYLAFCVEQNANVSGVLDQLEYYQTKAVFFFPAQELAGYDREIRSVLCRGHAVGLLVSGSTVEEITAQAAEGNRVLARIAYLNTHTILAPEVEDLAVQEDLKESGLLLWHTDIDVVTQMTNVTNITAKTAGILETAGRYRSKVRILFDASSTGIALLSRVLPELVQDRYDLRLAVETEL